MFLFIWFFSFVTARSLWCEIWRSNRNRCANNRSGEKHRDAESAKSVEFASERAKCFGHAIQWYARRCHRVSCIFHVTYHDRNANVGQIETAIIRHWLRCRGSGVFLIPPVAGDAGHGRPASLTSKRTRRGWFASRTRIYLGKSPGTVCAKLLYISLSLFRSLFLSGDRSVTAFLSRSSSLFLSRYIFPRILARARQTRLLRGDRWSHGLEIICSRRGISIILVIRAAVLLNYALSSRRVEEK